MSLSGGGFSLGESKNLEPLKIVEQLPQYCGAGVRVLDIGVGSGRNALFLARRGFHVDALDASIAAIDELNAHAREDALPFTGRVMDISDANPDFRAYAVVLFTYVLHFLTPTRATSLLTQAAAEAGPGTLHVIGAITEDGDFSRETSPEDRFYPEPSYLRRLYTSEEWGICMAFDETRGMLQTHRDGAPMLNLVSFVVARKKK